MQWKARQSKPGEQSPSNDQIGSRTGEGQAGCAVGEKKRVGVQLIPKLWIGRELTKQFFTLEGSRDGFLRSGVTRAHLKAGGTIPLAREPLIIEDR